MTREFKTYTSSSFELPPLARQIKESCLSTLINQCNDLFNNCDDIFFDLSSNATSNNEQNLYFESMREIRIKKAGVLRQLQQILEDDYQGLSCTESTAEDEEETNNPASLELIENDELEQKIAIKAMSIKARADNQEGLYQLTCRLDFLIPQKTINENNNPFTPEKFAKAFGRACEQLELNIKARIILYKQFEQRVFRQLDTLYNQLNQQLINAGILPKIQGKIQKQASPSTSDAQQSLNNIQTNSVDSDFSSLQQLISQVRQGGNQGISIIALIPDYNPNAPSMPRYDLISSLAQIQASDAKKEQDQLDIRKALESILTTRHGQGNPQSIASSDEDIINLVSMFFDYVLDDSNIPVPIQALIARLQLPVLRKALADEQFLKDKHHPARQLINSIADSAQGWSDSEPGQQKQLYDKIHEAVHAVLDQEHENTEVFKQQLARLQEFFKNYERKSSLIEKRVSEASVGRAKTTAARKKLKAFLDERTKDRHLPNVVAEFLENYWQQVMLLILLREGESSQSWLEYSQVVDDIIWSCQPHDDPKSQRRLASIKSTLFSNISRGLGLISNDQGEIKQQIDILQRLHEKLQANDRSAPIVAECSPQKQEIADPVLPKYSAIERQQKKQERIQYEFIQKAERIPLNTWIAFVNKDGDLTRRRLTARVDESDTYIFINRFGSKPIELDRKDFARMLQNQTAQEIDKRPLFDRAINSLKRQLESRNG